jgi:periplasmic protein TonB
MSGMRLPLTLSTAGHAILCALLVLWVTRPPPPQPAVTGGIEVVLGQSSSQPQAVLAPEAVSQAADPSPVAALPPQEIAEPEPVIAASEPSPEAVTEILPSDQTEALTPPPHNPVVRQPAKPVVRRPQPRAAVTAPIPAPSPLAEAAQTTTAASQYTAGQSAAAAAMPATVPGPDLAANYGAMISAWFESHKHYPESARQRGEEGGVKLRFRVDRFGHVLGYRLLESTGYADLDAGIDQMMRGAQLPAFPPGMTQPQIEVSVKLRFNLTR